MVTTDTTHAHRRSATAVTDAPAVVGSFTLLGRLGTDRDGTVHTGTDPQGRLAAVTLLGAEPSADPDARARFAERVAAARRLAGPWMVPVIGADPDAPRPWLATAFVPGPSLDDAVRTAGPLPPSAALVLARTLAGALAAAHRRGTVHGDLHPARVLLGPDGPWVTGPGSGDPSDYAAPEQTAGQTAGPASDVYSLGALLALAATGRTPADDPDLQDVPEPLRTTLAACLAPSPGSRPVADALLPRLPGPDPGPGWLGGTAAPSAVPSAAGPAAPAADPAATGTAERPAATGPGDTSAGPTGAVAAPVGHGTAPVGTGTAAAPVGPAAGGPPDPTGPRPGAVTEPAEPRRVSRRAVIGGAAALVVAGAAGVGVWAATGSASGPALRWERPDGTGSTVPPTTAAGLLLFVNETTGTVLAAFDPLTRQQRWRYDAGSVDQLLVGDDVVVPAGSRPVVCLDAATGVVRWEDSEPFRRTAALAVAGPVVVAGYAAYGARGRTSGLIGLRVTDGSTAWTIQGLADERAGGAPAVGGDGRVHVALDGSLVTVDTGTGRVLWRQQLGSVTGLRLCTGVLIAIGAENTALTGVDPATGRTLWTYPLGAGTPKVGADGTRLAMVRGDALVGLDPGNGTELWSTDLTVDGQTGTVDVRPILHGGLVLGLGSYSDGDLRQNELTVFAFGADDGAQRWSMRVAERFGPGPYRTESDARLVAIGDTLVVSADRGSLYAYGPLEA